MRWLLAGCCGLALISLSAALNLIQRPRYFAARPKTSVFVYCSIQPRTNMNATVQWYKAGTHGAAKVVVKGTRVEHSHSNNLTNAFLHIHKVRTEDTGVYFCKIGDMWGPGSQVSVVRYFDRTLAVYRTKMKDGLIVFQALLLAVCIAAILLRKRTLLEKRDSLYEEPETDHIYEGLAIETCGGGLYEELSVYAQAEGAEAPWEKD